MKTTAESEVEKVTSDPDLPDEAILSNAVRGKAGRRLLMETMRYMQALREIRDMPGVADDPAGAARAMQERAQQALATR